MKRQLIMLSIGTLAALGVSHQASAGWDLGPCPQPNTGPAPCIESNTASDGTWHFNGAGAHADDWHGAPGGDDIVFSGVTVLECGGLTIDCNLTLVGQIKKCQSPTGDWHVGIRATSFALSGAPLCPVISLSGFPWYSKAYATTPHCPFGDVCEDFNSYVPGASSYTFNIGSIDVSVLGIPRVSGGHLHGLVFSNPGILSFNSGFYDCSENSLGCAVEGEAYYNGGNGDSLSIY